VRRDERPRKQDWEISLSRARDAFNSGSSKTAAFALFQVLADSLRMAERCHDELALRGPEKLPPAKFKDWQKFLFTLYSDAWKVYRKNSYLVRSVMQEPQMTFKDLSNTAKIAMLALQDMNRGNLSKRTRDAVLTSLSELVMELDAAKDALGQQPEAHEDNERPTGATAQESANVPLVGQIAAGVPILAEEFIEDIFPLPTQLVGQGTLFMLKVVGDSMVNAAITDGDWVVVRQQPGAENGEIVVALIDGEVTVKTLKLSDDGHRWLIPHNPSYKPILGDDATILGKVVAILRRIR
jgi:SOS-response transcriptional repressor LexA